MDPRLTAGLGPVVMADDPCEAALGSADPTGPRNYYRARYYDPKLGRFLSEDPIGFAGGDVNLFAYVRNNPARFTDPSGLEILPNVYKDALGIPLPTQPVRTSWEILQDALRRTRNRTPEDFLRDPSNRENHCVLNCELEGQSWPVVGPGLSWVSDYVVVTSWPPPGFTLEDDPRDRQANASGRWAARNCLNCQEVCGGMDWR